MFFVFLGYLKERKTSPLGFLRASNSARMALACMARMARKEFLRDLLSLAVHQARSLSSFSIFSCFVIMVKKCFVVKLCSTAVKAEMGLTWGARQRAFALVNVLAQIGEIGNGCV